MTLVTRQIDLTLTLSKGSLTHTGENQVKLRGHKCDLYIENPGSGLGRNSAQLRVYGMSQADMEKFSTNGRNMFDIQHNEISIDAGDSVNGMKQVFVGTLAYAAVCYNAAQDVYMDINATPGLYHQMTGAAANSYPGQADVASIVEGLAKQMGFAFENHGVNTQLSDHYLCGDLISQLQDVVHAAGIRCCIEQGVVKIWPGNSAQKLPIIDLAPHTGLIGYPSFTRYGLAVEMEFRNDLQIGRRVNVSSSVPGASGVWYIHSLRHEISTQTHQGPWKTSVGLTTQGLAAH